MNKVILVGNLGNDPDVRRLESGTPVAKIRIATTETYRNRNGERFETTEWHNVTLWRSLAELAERFLHKGSKVYVEGKLRSREFQDREGHRRRVTEIEAENIIIFDKRNSGRQAQAAAPVQEEPTYQESEAPYQEYGPEEGPSGFSPESGEEPVQY
ncbi:MAG: single-stranded DNA-binding protein [Flavobacteriales bacterium]|nr:single-stranded DNA-binding protein [Flavobacteriales bacterium]